jgi:hypothetical protein
MSDTQWPSEIEEHPREAPVADALLHAVGAQLLYRARWWESLGRNSLRTVDGESLERVVIEDQSLVVVCTVPRLSLSCGVRFPVSRFTDEHRGFTEPVMTLAAANQTEALIVTEAHFAVNITYAVEFIEDELMEFFDTTDISAVPQRERDGFVELLDVAL